MNQFQASNVGRGRGYSGKNKDIVHGPPKSTDTESYSTSKISQRLINNQMGYNDSLTQAPAMPACTSPPKVNKPITVPKADAPKNNNYKRNSGSGNSSDGTSSVTRVVSKQTISQKNSNNSGSETTAKISQYTGHNVHILNAKSSENSGHFTQQEERSYCGAGSLSDENSQSVLFFDEKYAFLIKQIKLLSSQDDGILTNQKLQHIEGILNKTCTQPQQLRNALDAMAVAAILEARTSSCLSLMCCSVWFTHSQMLGQRLHHVFMDALTDKIDGLEVSLEGADQYLVNAVSLLSAIYTETKMLGPEELKSVARLIVQVTIALLECNTQLALRTLNVQLMTHGKKLYQSVPDKIESLSISARKLLIARQPPAPSCRIWLTLLSDQCLYRLEPLPKYLQDFYAVHLDDSSSACQDNEVQKERQYVKPKPYEDYKILQDYNKNCDAKSGENPRSNFKQDLNRSSETRTNESVKNAQNIRENRSRKSDSSDKWSTHSNGDRNHDYQLSNSRDDVFEEKNLLDSSYDSSGVSDSNVSENNEYYNSNGIQNFSSERKPRPILGAGARLVQPANPTEYEQGEQPHYEFEGDVAKFCPSIPPPNFVPKQAVKIISASQDTTDYWNTPPPTSVKARLSNLATQQVASSLASRMDLNSWRQQANGLSNNFSYDPDSNGRNSATLVIEKSKPNTSYDQQNKTDSDDSQSHFPEQNVTQYEDSTIILDVVKTSGRRQEKSEQAPNFNRQNCIDSKNSSLNYERPIKQSEDAVHVELKQKSNDTNERVIREKKNIPYEKKYDAREMRRHSSTYDEEDFDIEDGVGNLQIESKKNQQSRNRKNSYDSDEKRDSDRSRSNRNAPRTRRILTEERQRISNRDVRKDSEEKESNWRQRDGKQVRGIVPKSEGNERGIEEDWDKDAKGGDEKKPAARREQRPRVKRDPMEVSKKASYWTHDDRCDKDYDD